MAVEQQIFSKMNEKTVGFTGFILNWKMYSRFFYVGEDEGTSTSCDKYIYCYIDVYIYINVHSLIITFHFY